jgi:hypothetical protein
VIGTTFEQYSRYSIDAAVHVVCGSRRNALLVTYTLAAREAIPLLKRDVDWPLARRGKAGPTRRGMAQGVLPWNYETEQSLLSLYQHLPGTGGAYASLLDSRGPCR